MIEADALIFHFNTLMEAVQPEGNTDFSDLLPKIESICTNLGVPVIAKEVGWGIDYKTAKRLVDVGWHASMSLALAALHGQRSRLTVTMEFTKQSRIHSKVGNADDILSREHCQFDIDAAHRIRRSRKWH